MDHVFEAQEAWRASAEAWISVVDGIDVNRELILDELMVEHCGDVLDKDVLDIGCGEGRFARMLAKSGARVTGVEPTDTLRLTAEERHPDGAYVSALAESLPFDEASFDLAVFYLVLIDIPDFRAAIREAARVLRPGGRLVVANLLPFATAGRWIRDDSGQHLYRSVDKYFEERADRYAWSGIDIFNWHRPLEAYLQAFLGAGLRLVDYREPCPSPNAVERHPAFAPETRVPLFCTMVWSKT